MRRRFINSHKTFDYSKYMTIEVLEDGYEVSLTRDIEYNINGHKWMSLKANFNSPTLKKGDLLSFRCSLMPGEKFGYFKGNGKAINLRGNILSLLFKDDINLDISGYKYVFSNTFVFSNGNNIICVEKNFLPATTLGVGCYDYMFMSCVNLVQAPSLPATTLADNCYNNMFVGCTSLTEAPELPAEELAWYCYDGMFSGCTSLTTAPELPATTLVYCCYKYMFRNCSNLSYIKMLATNSDMSYYLTNWVEGVANSGIFVKHINMTSLPSGNSGIPEGWTVVNDQLKIVNRITYTISSKPTFGSFYNITFNSEYEVKSSIKIGISNGDIINLFVDNNSASSLLKEGDNVLGISFSTDNFMNEIEDDFYIYKIVIL